ncbi:MAG: AAA family ATPase [Collinsella sp.]|uniref:ATP-binding protein n=1 Tax=Collinsella sp. TaxID=1965294 RepID=UPI0039904CD6
MGFDEKGKAPVSIASLELENVKRVRAVELQPNEKGLTVLGGRNGQGKTSVLDAIAYALGGESMRPDRVTREGSATPAKMRVELSNGIVCERKGKNSSLTVTDTTGMKGGQRLLDEFIGEFALNLPKFLNMSDREKADYLLKTLGIADQLAEADRKVAEANAERTEIGRRAKAARKMAEDSPFHEGVPGETLDVSALLDEQMFAHETNQAIEFKRREVEAKRAESERMAAEVERLARELADATERMAIASSRSETVTGELEGLEADLANMEPADEQAAAEAVREAEAVNEMVRQNTARVEMLADADRLDGEYRAAGERVAKAKEERLSLLDGADLPLDGLAVEEGVLRFNGSAWGDMSGSEQLRVATAIVRKLKPECGFVLVDKLEQFDPQQLAEFGEWASGQGLQVIGTRVAVDDTCTVVIEDGRVVQEEQPEQAEEKEEKEPSAKGSVFKKGVF